METGVIGDLIQWAEFIFLMETSHKIKIVKKFRELPINKKHVWLDIPDNDHRMGLALVSMLE